MKTINEYLNGNTYPGRGVLIGKMRTTHIM